MTAAAEHSEQRTIVVGASEGLGLGISTALAGAGRRVVAVSRHPAPGTQQSNPGRIQTETADATDPRAAAVLLDRYEPNVVILAAGARPLIRPLQHQSWEAFSVNWHADVKIAFYWLREALLRPLPAGGRVIVISSGAALAGSPLSGGYAGAKATQRFLTSYAQEEAQRAGLDLTFTAVMPRLTPMTGLGRPAARAYASRAGQSEPEYLRPFGEPLTPARAGDAIVELVQTPREDLAPAYVLTGDGLEALA